MRKDDEREHAETEDEQVKCSNELLALMRGRMAKSGSGPEEKGAKKLEIPKPE